MRLEQRSRDPVKILIASRKAVVTGFRTLIETPYSMKTVDLPENQRFLVPFIEAKTHHEMGYGYPIDDIARAKVHVAFKLLSEGDYNPAMNLFFETAELWLCYLHGGVSNEVGLNALKNTRLIARARTMARASRNIGLDEMFPELEREFESDRRHIESGVAVDYLGHVGDRKDLVTLALIGTVDLEEGAYCAHAAKLIQLRAGLMTRINKVKTQMRKLQAVARIYPLFEKLGLSSPYADAVVDSRELEVTFDFSSHALHNKDSGFLESSRRFCLENGWIERIGGSEYMPTYRLTDEGKQLIYALITPLPLAHPPA